LHTNAHTDFFNGLYDRVGALHNDTKDHVRVIPTGYMLTHAHLFNGLYNRVIALYNGTEDTCVSSKLDTYTHTHTHTHIHTHTVPMAFTTTES